MNRREYFREEELKEMLIAAENFDCMAEVLADLDMTAEEARKIIWDEEQEGGRLTLFYFGLVFGGARAIVARRISHFNALQQKSVEAHAFTQ